MSDNLKLLRYNTGNDKKAFVEFKDTFDAVIFNATIVAYSGASVSDIISIHMNKYIIDPQTYILQHDSKAFMSSNGKIKASVLKYLEELPQKVRDTIVNERRALSTSDINSCLEELVEKVYKFQVEYISRFIQKKDYGKYLEFVQEEENSEREYSPQFIIAPYFRLKNEYSNIEIEEWLSINRSSLELFTNKYRMSNFPIAAQLLIDKNALCNLDFNLLQKQYDLPDYDYVFIWVDNFSPLTANKNEQLAFKALMQVFKNLNKRIIMAYGGFDSILLCHKELSTRLYGVAQSVGYGESRNITPVGGGLPVNKYYFYPTHERLVFGDVSNILSSNGFFGGDRGQAATRFYDEICDCEQCKQIIKNDINNFNRYNESVPYAWKDDIKRNRPTTEASFIATRHFMCCKQKEWEEIENSSLEDCVNRFLSNIEKYSEAHIAKIKRFLKTYVD